MKAICKTVHIHAPVVKVWETLTWPEQVKQWMAEPEVGLEITADWEKGSPVLIEGFHHVRFVNKGTVLHHEPYRFLRYNFLSSLSHLPDLPENYTELEFALMPWENGTLLTLTLDHFPTETIFKHLDFYWNATLQLLKKSAERP